MSAHSAPSSTAQQAFTLGSAKIDSEEISLIGDKPLGAGMFGSVWKGKCRGTSVAVKIPNRRTLTPAQMSAFMTEMEIMKKIQHPYCCLFMGAAVDEGKCEIKIVTELCAGDMNKLILKTRRSTLFLSDWYGLAKQHKD